MFFAADIGWRLMTDPFAEEKVNIISTKHLIITKHHNRIPLTQFKSRIVS